MTPDRDAPSRAALIRRLETNRNLYTEWVISREETQAILECLQQARRAAEWISKLCTHEDSSRYAAVDCVDCLAELLAAALAQARWEERERLTYVQLIIPGCDGCEHMAAALRAPDGAAGEE